MKCDLSDPGFLELLKEWAKLCREHTDHDYQHRLAQREAIQATFSTQVDRLSETKGWRNGGQSSYRHFILGDMCINYYRQDDKIRMDWFEVEFPPNGGA